MPLFGRLDPIFAALAPSIDEAPRTPGREKIGGTAEHGYLHRGPSGAGHFVKMVHNGIEYGMMASYAEGLNILHHANVGKQQQTVMPKPRPCAIPSTTPTTSTSQTLLRSGAAAVSSHHGCWILLPPRCSTAPI